MAEAHTSEMNEKSLQANQIKDLNTHEILNSNPVQENPSECQFPCKIENKISEQISKEALLSKQTANIVQDEKPKMALKNLLKKSSFSGLVSTLRHKRLSESIEKKEQPVQNLLLTDSDLRKHIFNQKRDRETMKGLRVMDLTKAVFIRNFLLGVGLGTVLALVIKLLYELSVKIVLG